MKQHTILIVDDHTLFSNSLKSLVESYRNFSVVGQLKNGQELQVWFQNNTGCDLILLDINMPVMNGRETMEWLKEAHPEQKVLALSMEDDDSTIIAMLRNGAKGYILKDIDPLIFRNSMEEVIHKGFYYSDKITQTLLSEVIAPKSKDEQFGLSDREMTFLKHACSEKTYKEIASEMYLSPKTIDGYRESLFKKLNVKSRIGLVLFAIKNSIVQP